jgi:predicted nucleic acid-binding protein
MTELVVDSSVAIKWFAREPQADLAEAILASGREIHAPELLCVETANGLWKKWRKDQLAAGDVGPSVAKLRSLVDRWHLDGELVEDAAALSLSLAHPVYDCIYLALARKLRTVVVTADTRLLAIAPAGLAVALAGWRP